MTDFSATRRQFAIPEGIVYLDGNSLGPLPIQAEQRLAEVAREEWGKLLIKGWNEAGWMAMPRRIGDRIGRLIGAEAGTVVMGDTLSIKVFQAVAAAAALVPERRVILSDRGNFPSDLYIAEGLIKAWNRGYQLKLVEPEEVEAAIDDTVAVTMITEVDYRTGRRHDMKALTRLAHDKGAVAVWDLAHSAGAFAVDLAGCQVDFAVGCTYKYLNGGPGAPAFIYVAPRHAERAEPILSGWLGHEQPFAFDIGYRPGRGIERMRVGTPPILALAALETALDVWEAVDMGDLRARSIELSELFIADVERRCPEVALASPRDPQARGSQVSFRHKQGYAIMQALIADGVIGDFRAPDNIRFGFTPLYIGREDVTLAVDRLERILREKRWDQPHFHQKAAVT